MATLAIGRRISLKNILFATDFSPCSDTALPYALAIADKCGATLYASHVVPSADYLFTAPDLWPAHLQRDGELQEEVVEKLNFELRGAKHETLFGVGDVSTVLSRQIEQNYIDLVVIGTHGRTGTRKLLMGSVAEKVFRQAGCPVLSVGPNVIRKQKSEIHFRHILQATNFGEESAAAFSYAVALAEIDETRLTLLHVAEGSTLHNSDLDHQRELLRRRLKEMVPATGEQSCELRYLVEFRRTFVRPAEHILEIARHLSADLIVLGVRPTRGSIGSVTHLAHTTDQQIVAQASCPVLTVRG